MGSNSPRGRYDFEDIPRLNALLDHDLLLNWVANKHIDWTNATDNLLTTGSGRFDGGVGIGVAPDALTLSIYGNSASPVSAILDNAGAGDVLVRFRLGGTSLFVLGVDNDDDKFKIATGTFLGTNTSLTIDSSGNFVIPGTITGGAYNTLHIIPGTGATGRYYVYLSSTGVEDDGFAIGIPNTATKGFKYGDDGTEHHYFGNTGQVEITDDGIVNAINFTAGTLTVSDGSIDDTDGSIALGATNLTGVGTIASSDVTITGAGTNPALRINQGADAKGIQVFGFDDHAAKRIDMYVNSSGIGIINSPADWYFTYADGLRLLIQNFAMTSYVDFTTNTDKILGVGDRTYGFGYYATDGSLQLVAGHAINTNVRMAMDSSGNFDFKTGEILFGNKIKFTQSDGNEYIDSLNDGYMDYGATTGHRFNTDKLVVLVTGRVGIGTATPNAPLEVKGAKPAGNIGGFQSGMLHVTGTGTAEFSNSVITGHSAYDTNTQLWYLGSITDANNNIAFINRQNAAMCFYTNNADRMIIDAAGNVGINETAPQDKLEVNGTILVKDKLKFTQDDGNEYIDSLADGYLDLAATTGIRLNGNVRIGSAVAPTVALDVTGAALISTTLGVTGVATLGDSSQMATSAAPTADADIANKKYVDDSVVASAYSGNYTGDGTESKAIAGVGFTPKYVKITDRKTVNGNAIQVYWTNSDIIDDNANGGAIRVDNDGIQTFAINAIISFDADGFTVDDGAADDHPNKDGITYNFICMG